MILNMNEEEKLVILEMMECSENITNGMDVEKYKKRLDELLNNASDKVADYYTKHPEELSLDSKITEKTLK
jgi:hypothetical protein